MSAHIQHTFLLSPNFLGNLLEKGPFRVIRRSTPLGREGGDVIPGGWTPVDIGDRAYIAGGSDEPFGDQRLQKLEGGDRIEQGICLILPNEILARIIIDENETDSDIVQYNGANYRCTAAQQPDREQGFTSVTAQRIQPRNLPVDLPVFP